MLVVHLAARKPFISSLYKTISLTAFHNWQQVRRPEIKKAEAYKSQTPIFHYWKLQTELPFTSLLSVHHDQHLKLSPVTTVSLLEVCILPWKYQCQATPGKEKSGFSRSQCKEWAYYCCLLGLHNNNLAVMLLQTELVAGVYFCM